MKMKKHKFSVFKNSKEDTEYIYHYTDVKGAIGILSKKNIWMTNIRYLNDWMEGRYFYESLMELLENELEIYKKLKEKYEKCFDNSYIASFSTKPDLLSQYKYYGNICIAFDILEVNESRERLNNYPNSGFEVNTKVTYKSPEEYKETIKKFANDNNLINKLLLEDIKSLLIFFCFFGLIKHPGFSEEEESRICHFWYDPKGVKYRFNNERRIPFIEFNILPSTIKKIIIGPHICQSEIAFDFNKFINNNKEFNHVRIYCSDIPFIP